MNSYTTSGIVLNRINFGEADRILTVLTPDYGKLRLIAKGVRKEKSKLAGGIELFSISTITFIPPKRDIGTVVSTRLLTHWGNIVRDMGRTTFAYKALKTMNDITEENCEGGYYHLLLQTLRHTNDQSISLTLIESWFYMRVLSLSGHTPNLRTDAQGVVLEPNTKYQFDFSEQAFVANEKGMYTDAHIKMLRLLLEHPIDTLASIQNTSQILEDTEGLLKILLRQSAE